MIFRSRFNGILATDNRLYILYHINKGVIKWVYPAERALLQVLTTLFTGFPIYTTQLLACIAVSNESMEIGIAILVYGVKNGRVSSPSFRDNIESQKAMKFFTALCNLLSEIFYLPMDKLRL